MVRRAFRTALAGGLTVLLAACGGGGGGGAAPAPTPPSVPPLSERCETGSVARFDTEALQVGQSAEVHLLSCGPTLRSLQWSVTGPSALNLNSARSPSLSVLPTAAGSHRFSVSFEDANGRSFSGGLDLNAVTSTATRGVVTRGEPSVWGGGQLSLRAWPQGLSAPELVGASWRWSQVSGPTLSINNPNSAVLIVNAPSVAADTVVTLRASLTLAGGTVLQDDFRLLVQPPPNPAASPLFNGNNAASRVYPYQANGPFAAALSRCVFTPNLQWSPNNLCTLGELPLLGQAGPTPTVEQVMQRVLVSNDWMGEVFERFLREQDTSGDLRRMLAATTAVVIGGRIRPAFYWSTTGAIYLDASYLWLTPEQRDTVSEAPDPRSANGPLLRYSSPWRYVRGNQFATPARPVANRDTRPLSEIQVELGRLLYHELTHAGDFLPPAIHASLNAGRKVFESVPSNTPSVALQQQLPFFSQEMVALGRVLFFGETATPTQNAYTPENIVTFFSNDRVNDDYAYALSSGQSVPREDIAMLIEEAMVQLRMGVLRDVAITPRLQEGASSADLLVVWGQRGRVGDPAIRPRLQLALSQVMPWITTADLNRLAPPLLLRPGRTWGENLDQAAMAANRPRALTAPERLREAELERERRLRQH